MSNGALLTPAETDRILRYPRGRAEELARKGILPHVALPCGEIRFNRDVIQGLATGRRPCCGVGVPNAN